jgi:tRNA dimethylallyltransferase
MFFIIFADWAELVKLRIGRDDPAPTGEIRGRFYFGFGSFTDDKNMGVIQTQRPPVMVILGPTASGKSALALAVAKRIGGEIISADSRQLYRELDIGAAKPSKETLEEVKHHFVDEKNIGDPFTAGDFATEALERIGDIHRRGKRAIVAGGSTLYLEGLIEGFADLPPGNPEIRARLLEELERDGKEQLYAKLLKRDPVQAATLDPTKSQRLIRSLEIIEITGLSVTELHARGKQRKKGLSFITAGLAMPRPLLYERINRRTDKMVDAGLCGEAERLYHNYSKLLRERKTSALQSVGYQELFQYFDGEIDLGAAITLIKQHTRNYAKRQLTFFSNRLTVNWVAAPFGSNELEMLADRLAHCCPEKAQE